MHGHTANPIWQYESAEESATEALGRRLGEACRGGEVILLDGPLGAGKTCLTGGLAAGLGVAGPAISPTYVILRSYPAREGLTLHHLDFYRLGGDEDLETVGLEDCLGPDTVVVAEWPGRCPHAFDDFTLAIHIEPTGEATRLLRGYAGGLDPIP